MKTLKSLWVLAKSGYVEKEEYTLKQALNFLFRLFLILIVFKVLYLTFTYLLSSFETINIPTVSTDFKVDQYSGISQFLILTILLPIFEELTFRLNLNFTKSNFILMSAGLVYIVSKVIFDLYLPINIMLIAAVSLLLTIFLKKQELEKLSKFWKNNRRMVFYALLITFALIHCFNYNLNISNFIYIPILAIRHFIAGLILSYARLKSGIVLSIGLHILNNGLFSLPLLLLE